MEQGKFYRFKTGSIKDSFECVYSDKNLAVLKKKETEYTWTVTKGYWAAYEEHTIKLGGSGHLVVLSYLHFDKKVTKQVKVFVEDSLKEYLDKMGKLEYKIISVTPVSWEENQS